MTAWWVDGFCRILYAEEARRRGVGSRVEELGLGWGLDQGREVEGREVPGKGVLTGSWFISYWESGQGREGFG